MQYDSDKAVERNQAEARLAVEDALAGGKGWLCITDDGMWKRIDPAEVIHAKEPADWEDDTDDG